MQSEIIYLLNSKLYFLEEFGSQIIIRLPQGSIKPIRNIEAIGMPFNIETKKVLEKVSGTFNHPFKNTSEFQALMNLPLIGSIEYYLREAKIEYTLNRKGEDLTQNMGFIAGEATNMNIKVNLGKLENSNINFSKSIVPCQFYLIKEKI